MSLISNNVEQVTTPNPNALSVLAWSLGIISKKLTGDDQEFVLEAKRVILDQSKLADQLIALHEKQRWIPVSERLPEVNAQGESKYVQFCVYWASSGAVGVFPAVYLDCKELQDTYSGEYKKWTGWHTYSYREDADCEEIYEPITLNEGDYIVGWQPFAAAPALTSEVQHG